MLNTEIIKPTGRIMVIKTVAGKLPLEIRGAWVMKGVTLPCYPTIGYLCGEGCWILTGEEIPGRRRGVIVPQAPAIGILCRHNLMAAMWWLDRRFPHVGGNFFFGEEEIAIVEGVEDAPMHFDIEIS